MSAPRLNQTVWFWKDGEARGSIPEPSIVTDTHKDGTVDLWVFCQHGAQRTEEKVFFKEYRGGPLIRFATEKLSGPETKRAEEKAK